MDLKISLKSQLYALRELIIISIVYFGLVYFLYLNTEFDLFKMLFLSTFVFYFIAFLLPIIILHTNYLNNTYKHITVGQNRLVINNTVYVGKDIDKIKIYATSQHINDLAGAYTLPYAMCYYYVEICLIDGKKINLSSLIDYKIDKIIRENFKTIEIIEQPSLFIMLLTK